METSTLACGWPASQASSQGPGQSINQQIGHKEGFQARPASRHGHLSISVSLYPSLSHSLSLSLSFCVSEAHRREDTADGKQAIRRQPLGHPDKQLSKPWSGQPSEQPAATKHVPLSHAHTRSLSISLSLSPPVSEGIVRQESRQARRHRIGQEGRQATHTSNWPSKQPSSQPPICG